MRFLVGQGRHPDPASSSGSGGVPHAPQTDATRAAAAQRALLALPDDATTEQRDKVWHDAMTAPERRAGLRLRRHRVTGQQRVAALGLRRRGGQPGCPGRAPRRRPRRARPPATTRRVRPRRCRWRTPSRHRRPGRHGLRPPVSRERDPQLHAHIVVSAKVLARSPDGTTPIAARARRPRLLPGSDRRPCRLRTRDRGRATPTTRDSLCGPPRLGHPGDHVGVQRSVHPSLCPSAAPPSPRAIRRQANPQHRMSPRAGGPGRRLPPCAPRRPRQGRRVDRRRRTPVAR